MAIAMTSCAERELSRTPRCTWQFLSVCVALVMIFVSLAVPDSARADAAGAVPGPYREAAKKIATGNSAACAILQDGQAKCWATQSQDLYTTTSYQFPSLFPWPAMTNPINFGGGRKAKQIVRSVYHTCAILDSGTTPGASDNVVRCWGKWIGSDPAVIANVSIGAGEEAEMITLVTGSTSSSSEGCVVLKSGLVKCWTMYTTISAPTTLDLGTDASGNRRKVVALSRANKGASTGDGQSCVIYLEGDLKCWGGNYGGKLGQGDTANRSLSDVPSMPPVRLGEGRTAIAVTAGTDQTCVILDTYQLRCFGRQHNNYPQFIGDNEYPDSVAPLNVGAGRTVRAVSAGNYEGPGIGFTAVTCSVLDNGVVRCWNNDMHGQLGDGNGGNSYGPNDVNLGAGQSAVAVDATGRAVCTTLLIGEMKCWGDNFFAGIKAGIHQNKVFGDDETPASLPALDFGVQTVEQLETGFGFSCARFTSGVVRCWGKNTDGQLGIGSTVNSNINTLTSGSNVAFAPGETAVKISVGYYHACAILNNNFVRCWGMNNNGALGLNTSTTFVGDQPGEVAGDRVLFGPNRTPLDISVGQKNTCLLYHDDVDNDNKVICWGDNTYGQLGNGTTPGTGTVIGDNEEVSAAAPVSIDPTSPSEDVVQIDVGFYHACARIQNGTMKCWGANQYGQLGQGNTTGSNAPVAVPVHSISGVSITDISLGSTHTCAVLSNGSLRCWGTNDSGVLGFFNGGQLIGDNEVIDGNSNVNVGFSVAEVEAGSVSTCARSTSNAVKCWGAGGYLGVGNTTGISQFVSTASDLPSISFGTGFNPSILSRSTGDAVCAGAAGGAWKCWGSNNFGQAGVNPIASDGNGNFGDDETPAQVPNIALGAKPAPIMSAPGNIMTTSVTGGIGTTYSCMAPSFWFAEGAIALKWYRNGAYIGPVTGPYTVTSNDDGAIIECRATATNNNGASSTTVIVQANNTMLPPRDMNLSANFPIHQWKNYESFGASWYASDAEGIGGFSLWLNGDPNFDPGNNISTTAQTGTFTYGVHYGEGDNYLHVRPMDAAGNWGELQHYGPMKVDRSLPFVAHNVSPIGGGLFRINMTASDSLSGLRAAPFSYDFGATWTPGSEFIMSPDINGHGFIRVLVRDNADNTAVYPVEFQAPDACWNLAGFQLEVPPGFTFEAGSNVGCQAVSTTTTSGGDTTVTSTGTDGSDTITGGVSIDNSGSGGSGGTGSGTGGSAGEIIVVIDAGEGDDIIYGGTGPGTSGGTGASAVIDAGEGNDTIYGTENDDTIDAGEGDDRVYGGSSNDTVDGAEGNDTIYSQHGDDTIDAGEGDDKVDSGHGDDTVDAGDGDDFVDGSAGGDKIKGGKGSDNLFGCLGPDTMAGDAGDDRLFGCSGNDTMRGGDDDDYIKAGRGNDTLLGGTGRDEIDGEEGDDVINSVDQEKKKEDDDDADANDQDSKPLAFQKVEWVFAAFLEPEEEFTEGDDSNQRRRRFRKSKPDRVHCGPGKDTVIADRKDKVAKDCENVVRRRRFRK